MKAKSLITQPYRNWKDAREDLTKHAVLHYHKDSMKELESFISCCENQNARIDQSITKASTEVVNRNRKYLSSILRESEYYSHQGIALTLIRLAFFRVVFPGVGGGVNLTPPFIFHEELI